MYELDLGRGDHYPQKWLNFALNGVYSYLPSKSLEYLFYNVEW